MAEPDYRQLLLDLVLGWDGGLADEFLPALRAARAALGLVLADDVAQEETLDFGTPEVP